MRPRPGDTERLISDEIVIELIQLMRTDGMEEVIRRRLEYVGFSEEEIKDQYAGICDYWMAVWESEAEEDATDTENRLRVNTDEPKNTSTRGEGT